MANPITVPRLGWSMEEGTFVEWLKRDGEAVRVGEPLFVLEGEKAAESIEAIDEGVLRLMPESPKPGEVVKVGQTLAWIAAPSDSLDFLAPSPSALGGEGRGEGGAARRGDSTPLTPNPSPPEAEGEGRQIVTPRARRAIRKSGVDIGMLVGSGRGGRIRERDVRAVSTGGRVIPHSRTRRAIAARMVVGVTQAAPVTLATKVEATGLVNRRQRLKESSSTVPTIADLIVSLTAATLRRHPLLQAQWRDDGSFVPEGIHIAIAVDTEGGLLAPVIRDVDRIAIDELAMQSRVLIEKTRAGQLSADELHGATFTVSNLGGFGIDAFTPIITLPQCAVLGIGRIVREPVCDGEAIVVRDMVTLSLTFDHRVIDGAPAARFLQDLGRAITRGES